MQRKPSRTPVKTVLIAAITGLALTALTGCYLGGGPFRHAFYGGAYHRGGYGYHEAPPVGPYSDPETRGYRHGGYCGG